MTEVELGANLRHPRTKYQWLVGLITDIAAQVVSLSDTAHCVGGIGGGGGRRKRKLESSLDGTSKHISRDNCDNTTTTTSKKHSCLICQVECRDFNSLFMHLKGKKHLKMMSALARSSQSSEEKSDGNTQIEIITPHKSNEDILAGIPNCSRKGTIRWNNQDIYRFVPLNTINVQNKISSLYGQVFQEI